MTLNELRAAVDAACTCGGGDSDYGCPACEVWHALALRAALADEGATVAALWRFVAAADERGECEGGIDGGQSYHVTDEEWLAARVEYAAARAALPDPPADPTARP